MARSPVVGRTLADHGATVLKIISHERPRREMFDCETNHGKRTLVLELSTAEGKQRLWDLLKVRAWIAADGLSDGVRDELRHQVQSAAPGIRGVLVRHGDALGAPSQGVHLARPR